MRVDTTAADLVNFLRGTADVESLLPIVLVSIGLLFVLIWFIVQLTNSTTNIQLHGYQKDFVDSFAVMHGGGGSRGENKIAPEDVLQMLVDRAMNNDTIKKAIFDDFHCIHCGSVKPEPWIKTRKGDKKFYSFQLTSEAKAFLKQPILVPVQKVGDPPKRQIVPGPNRSDIHKASRCCIDWAIKNYGAVVDGKPKPE